MKLKVGNFAYLNNCEKESEAKKVIIVARGVKRTDDKKCIVQYLVKPVSSTDFADYQVVSRKDLVKIVDEVRKQPVYSKVFLLDSDGQQRYITLTAIKTYNAVDRRSSELRIGYSICCPADIQNVNNDLGIKIAKHRAKTKPYTVLYSPFRSEFDKDTIYAILNAKKDYILANPDRFLKKKEDNVENASTD